MSFKQFKVIRTGQIVDLPEHYKDIPEFSKELKLVKEVEVDKVVLEDMHELPVDQRIVKTSKKDK